MKHHNNKLFGIIVLLAIVTLSFISCSGDMAELKVTNDTSTTYFIKVKIDGETVTNGEIAPGVSPRYSRGSGFSYRVYVSKSSFVSEILSPYFYGNVNKGDVEEEKISDILYLLK